MKNKKNKELAVCGFAAVKALEAKNPDKIKKLYFNKVRANQFSKLCKTLAGLKRPYNMVENEDLEKLSASIHHQGVVALIDKPEIKLLDKETLTEWLHAKEDVIIMDHVGNANNLGAIVRSAAFFGLKNIVLISDEADSLITTSSYRVAQGAMESIKIYKTDSLEKFLSEMSGKMLRVGTDVSATTPVSQIRKLCAEKNGKGALIVLGNEENGISSETKQNCDVLVTIPTPAKLETFDSLNVAQAASVIFYAMTQN
ncbi:MAG: RNA methyltransferase [Treponemataceae bacterium]|nr:RNA methyltransferase [Treponemataceae bacterium]